MTSRARITFLGAAGTVTGSKYLIETGKSRVLVDCGLFQGLKALRLRNWRPLPVDVGAIDAVVLTHAHLDHTGYLPALCKQGYRGPVYCTPSTRALCRILLPDSGHIQEEDAYYANKRGFSKHHPALPLYTREEAEASLGLLRSVAFDKPFELAPDIEARFQPVGHILGAASVELTIGGQTLVFSGDVGRPNDPVMWPPRPLRRADVLVVESTYGDRLHTGADPAEQLATVVRRTCDRGGVLLVPSFAVGRAQTLLYLLHTLRNAGRIPRAVPVYLNSPMAVNATEAFCDHHPDHRLSPAQCEAMCAAATYVNSVEDSKALNDKHGPMIVISASGMATGGRVLHHLRAFAGDRRNTILFAGYQAAGTRGEAMLNGAQEIKMHGQLVAIRAEVDQISGLSAHADYAELIEWLRPLGRHPRRVFVTHGEASAAAAFKQHLRESLGWDSEVPTDGEIAEL